MCAFLTQESADDHASVHMYALSSIVMGQGNALLSACASVSGASVCLTQSSDDPALGDLVLAFEALDVDAEQDRGAVAGPLGDLSWGDSPVEPGGQTGVAEIVGPTG